MKTRYVYSLNGENYVGAFDSREAAERAAVVAARRSTSSPTTVFVARAIISDPAARGHAHAVVAAMSTRARQAGPPASGRYVADLTDRQIADLDEALETTILAWLNKHHLLPASFTVEAISEHPVTMGAMNTGAMNHAERRPCENHVYISADEVHDLGLDNLSLDRPAETAS